MKAVAVVVVFLVIASVVIYAIIMYELYKNSKWVFAPYVYQVPTNACQPLINVTQLTPDEIAARNALLKEALNIT